MPIYVIIQNMNSGNYSFLVLDWNGTLVDDVHLCHDLLNKMLIECGHPSVSFDSYRDIFTFPIIEYYRRAGFHFKPEGNDDFGALANEFRADYESSFPGLSLYPDVIDFLETAKSEVDLYLLSATKEDLLLAETKEKRIDHYFKHMIGIGDIYGASKEAAGKKFFSDNGIDASKALFIGDSLHDEEVATSFGARCALISSGHQSKAVLERGKRSEKTMIFDSLSSLKHFLF